MADVDDDGRISAVLNRLKDVIMDGATVGGPGILEWAAGGDIQNPEVIRSRDDDSF